MKLYDFITIKHELLDNFKAYWMKEHDDDPSNYPTSMAPGNWDEQFQAWYDNEVKELSPDQP